MRMVCVRFIVLLFIPTLLLVASCTEEEKVSDADVLQEVTLPDDIPSLIEMLGEPQQVNQNEIIDKLAGMGQEAVPALIEAMGDGDPMLTRAQLALSRIGPSAVPALIEALQNDNYSIRYGAIKALKDIGPDAIDAVEPLKSHFQRATKNEQIAIMHALRDISPTSDVISLIRASLMVEDLRWYAMRVLGDIGPDASSAIPSILPYLEHEDTQTRVETIQSLAGIGIGEGVVEGIAGRLQDEESRVRQEAAQALGRFGPDGVAATNALVRALDDDEPGVQRAAAHSLGLIAPASEGAIDDLVDALAALEDPQARREAAWALGRFGALAGSAVPALERVAESDEYGYIRDEALEAIRLIEGTESGETVTE